MQIITAILAIAGAAAALPGGGQGDNSYPPSYGNGDPNAYSGPVCVTKSTCNAVYFTTTKQMPYKDTVTVTKTAYKPKVFTTYVPNAYVTTKYRAAVQLIDDSTLTLTLHSPQCIHCHQARSGRKDRHNPRSFHQGHLQDYHYPVQPHLDSCHLLG